MKTPEDVIIRPIITEKSSMDSGMGKYTFAVSKMANKTEIRIAVEKLFNVKVLKVNTLNYDGKKKRMGVHQGKTSSWKKAVITIDLDPKAESYVKKDGKVAKVNREYKKSIEEFGFGQ